MSLRPPPIRVGPNRPRWCYGIATLAILFAAGCSDARQHFVVDNFAGAKILLNLSGLAPAAPGHHLELWGRDSTDDAPDHQNIVRLLAGDGTRQPDGTPCAAGTTCTRAAYAIVPAVDLDDGCAIDDQGNLVTSPEFREHGAAQCKDPSLSPDENVTRCQKFADATVERIHQLTDKAPAPLNALVAWDDHASERPRASDQAKEDPPATPDARRQECLAFRKASPWSYDGNPKQLTNPLHGNFFGAVDFTSLSPPQLLGGITITTDYSLVNLRELWFTDTAAPVDGLDPTEIDCGGHEGTCRGRVILDASAPTKAAGALRFELRAPDGVAISGVASVEIALDRNPESF